MKKSLIALIAFTAWFAVVFQYFILLQNGKGSSLEITIRFFSFFTILTNLLVAITFTLLLLGNKGFFARITTLTAVSVYILVVGLVYNTILRFTWAPQGWQKLVDELLHTAVPLLVQVYWLVYVTKGTLHWKKTFWWLLYPACYCIYILIRGSMVHEYPYPFIDVNVLGAGKVALNCIILCVVFFGLFLLYVGLDKWLSKNK